MIALDTNVLVRFLVRDDEVQRAEARELVERAIEAQARLYVPSVVLCETVWVLSSSYRFGRDQISAVLDRVTRARSLEIERIEEVRGAIHAYAGGRGDFADYLIREIARRGGHERVATFDRELLREAGGFVRPRDA